MNTQSHIRDAVNIIADVTVGKEHVGKDFITYMVKFPDMTEKEGIQQGAFWDLSGRSSHVFTQEVMEPAVPSHCYRLGGEQQVRQPGARLFVEIPRIRKMLVPENSNRPYGQSQFLA